MCGHVLCSCFILHSHVPFQYQLETFTEGRKTAWAFDPYSGRCALALALALALAHIEPHPSLATPTGQPVDGPQNGPAPGPWDIAAQPSEMFKDEVKVFEVPHTASVKACHGCLGVGMIQCRRCLGGGQVGHVTCHAGGHAMHAAAGGREVM